ncbi:nuclear fusion protein FUS2 [Kluyveromyces marxianus]|uniref:Nuclear fusion protein FUS2 n=1 Tax=Kluyveromyces marxianus TaxID=4911 RepID=A0ABX6ETL8_KLUMA|nr:nuclear fusion protein FUS2 [Kluyveromyces marxianus]
MIKSRYSVYQINYPSNNVVTPIRTCREDNYELPNFYKSKHNPYSNSLWNTSTENREALNRIREKTANKRIREDRIESKVLSSAISETQSLVWDHETEPQAKKSYSPLDVESFSQKLYLNSDRPDSKTLSFIITLQKLCESELQYFEMLSLCLSTYKTEACYNKKFKNKLFNTAKNDELLVFGNIDTMAELSKLFSRKLLENIEKCSGYPQNGKMWNEIKSNDRICQDILKIDFASLIKSHLQRLKSTYHSYCLCHAERKMLLDSLKLQNTELFYKWYELCLKKSQFEKLEDLLELPLERLGQWGSLFENLCLFGDNLLPEPQSAQLNLVSKEFISYLRELNDELNELGKPKDKFIRENSPPTEQPRHQNSESFQQPKPSSLPGSRHDSIPDLSLPSSNCTSQAVSKSSSFYSDARSLKDRQNPMVPQNNIEDTSCNTEEHGVSLKQSMEQFNNLYTNLQKWDKALCKLELAKVLDRTLNTAIVWKNLIEFEPPNELFKPGNDDRTIYGTYVEKIDKQRQQVMILQLQDLRRKVIKPLQLLIQRCSIVKQKLVDRKTLKKEYIDYIKRQQIDKETHDAKKEILANSFQKLHSQLTESLPTFNNYATKVVTMLVSQYTLLMMEYMKILSGGDQFLEKELQEAAASERKLGDNFDILQLFCSSRYYTRQAVRENWTAYGDPRASRPARKLFEL